MLVFSSFLGDCKWKKLKHIWLQIKWLLIFSVFILFTGKVIHQTAELTKVLGEVEQSYKCCRLSTQLVELHDDIILNQPQQCVLVLLFTKGSNWRHANSSSSLQVSDSLGSFSPNCNLSPSSFMQTVTLADPNLQQERTLQFQHQDPDFIYFEYDTENTHWWGNTHLKAHVLSWACAGCIWRQCTWLLPRALFVFQERLLAL